MEPEQVSGAGGDWQVIHEVIDRSVVRQRNKLACGIACGEMLLRDRGIEDVDQARLARDTKVPVSCGGLARTLNTVSPKGVGVWIGGSLRIPKASDVELFEVLNSTGSWAAVLRQPLARYGHIVIADGIDVTGRVLIRDPWEGTRYRMEMQEFLNYWTTEGIFLNTS